MEIVSAMMNRLLLSSSFASCKFPCAASRTRMVHPRHFSIKKQQPCPFHTLGVPKDCNYAHVKSAFLQIAMRHHPDMQEKTASEEEQMKARDIFIKARHAFESLSETPNGGVVLLEHHDEKFDAWFKEQTGHDTPFQFMDQETMKEVAEMEETVGHGLDRDGGMWTLAAMVSNAVKDGNKDAVSFLRLESGDVKRQNGHIDGVLRRKRRPRK